MPQPVSSIPISDPPSWRFLPDAEKLSPFLLAILIGYAIVRGFCQASIKPFWYDEICTLILVRQQHISSIWSALVHGADAQPLFFYLAERWFAPPIADEHVALRTLSIFGFAATILCLFVLIKEHRGKAVALFCVSILMVTNLFDGFSAEARPYSILVGCISFALVCYQRASATVWVVLLAADLALAQSLHYYAFLAFVPFVLAEAVLFLKERKLRWRVWLAFACGFLPFAALWRFVSILREVYGQHFWERPSLWKAAASYGWFFNENSQLSKAVIAALAAVAVLGTMLVALRRASQTKSPVPQALLELILILAMLGLPVIGNLAAMISHGGMSARYLLPTILGFPLAAGYALPRLGRKSAALLLILTPALLVACLWRQERRFWSSYQGGHFVSPADLVENLVKASGREDLPVAVSDAHDFLPLAYYASAQFKPRIVSVVDAAEAVRYWGIDTADKELPILSSYFPLRVYDFEAFAARNPAYLLYSGNGEREGDWWPRKLQKDGYTLRAVGVRPIEEHDYFRKVFLVSHTRGSD